MNQEELIILKISIYLFPFMVIKCIFSGDAETHRSITIHSMSINQNLLCEDSSSISSTSSEEARLHGFLATCAAYTKPSGHFHSLVDVVRVYKATKLVTVYSFFFIKMGCSTTVVKYLVFFFNLVFAIAGAGLLALGILLKLKNNDIQTFIPDKYHLGLPPILLIIIGSVIFATAFFGCCGAIKESTCMLTTFAIILLTLLIVQIAIAAYAFLQVGDTADLKTSVTQVVEKSFNQYNHSKSIQEEFDFLQSFLHCCGVRGVQDWNLEGGRLPTSCCSNNNKNCTIGSTNAYKNGCGEKTYYWFKNGLDLLGILAVAIASIEIIGAVFALCLSSSIKNQLRREAYA